MAYLLGLFLMLAVLFSATAGNNFVSGLWDSIADKAAHFAFPKSEKEILISNLGSDYGLLDRFFSESTDSLLSSAGVSDQDKAILRKAAEAFSKSKNTVADLSSIIEKEKGLVKTATDKFLDFLKPDERASPEPTAIPPQCKLICEEN